MKWPLKYNTSKTHRNGSSPVCEPTMADNSDTTKPKTPNPLLTWPTALKAAGITLLSMLCSALLAAPFSASVSVLFSSPEKNDFVMSDLFAQVADARPVRTLEDRIVIVDIEHSSRAEIASTLEILSLCNPLAVGLDVNFANPGDEATDLYLRQCITAMPRLVLPLSVNKSGDDGDNDLFSIADKPFFFNDSTMGKLTYGIINLPSVRAKNSIREYATAFPLAGGVEQESFPCAVARMGGCDMSRLQARRGDNRLEKIAYPSREFMIIPWGELIDRVDDLEGKYVLVGAVNEASDMHATPINSYMAGIMIHAYSLA